MKKCEWCGINDIEEPYNSCDECVSNRKGGTHTVIDVPLKGDERWYKERWFRKDQKTWEQDIKSRKVVAPDGSVVHRYNEKGERVG